jgi:hypothetical protein
MGKTVTRVIGQGTPRRRTRFRRISHGEPATAGRCYACNREPGVYCAPDEVITLIEDIQLLEIVIDLLGRLDKGTINDGGNESGTTIRRLNFILYAVRNQARDRLAREFLAGQPPIKPRTKPQTLADIWALFKESLDRRDVTGGKVMRFPRKS